MGEPLRVAFRVAVDARLGPGYVDNRFWADQPTPPPGQEERYQPDPERPWVRWPPPAAEGSPSPQERRVKQARYFTGVDLDPARCRFTYRRFTLVGEVALPPGPYAWSRPREAHDAIGTVLTTAQWTAAMLYRVADGVVHEAPLPNLTLSVRAIR